MDAAAAKAQEDVIETWQLLGPFKSSKPGKISLEFPTPFESEFVKRGDGQIDQKAEYIVDGQAFRWTEARAEKKGKVNLGAIYGASDWSVAYGYAEIESIHARETVLTCGSDDGIKIWLNGKVVHSHEIGRTYRANSDAVSIQLEAGINRLLVKVDNYTLGWAFGVTVPKANF